MDQKSWQHQLLQQPLSRYTTKRRWPQQFGRHMSVNLFNQWNSPFTYIRLPMTTGWQSARSQKKTPPCNPGRAFEIRQKCPALLLLLPSSHPLSAPYMHSKKFKGATTRSLKSNSFPTLWCNFFRCSVDNRHGKGMYIVQKHKQPLNS